jgi:hypothetical protein
MIFSLAVNLALFVLAPLGSVTLAVGDWMLNAFIVAKLVENYMPNGPAVIGNMTEMFPVLVNIAKSAVDPLLQVNYTGMLQEAVPDVNLTEWSGQVKDYLLNVTVPVQ